MWKSVAIVTSASSRIGKATALRLARDSDDASYVTGTELFVDGGFAQV
jgi:NAD(P)-dependent dehydrogenase (short-subunit alcohol dehydrogenase family)